MKLASHETIAVDVPLPTKVLGYESMHHVVLRLRTDDGVEGVGWATTFLAFLEPAFVAAVDGAVGTIIGRNPMERGAIVTDLAARASWWGPGFTDLVVAVVDIALHDLAGKALGLPVHALLGGPSPATVPCYASHLLWRDWGLDRLAADAGALVDTGFTAMKFRIGANDAVSDEIDRIRVMRQTVGPDVTVLVDINQGWDVPRVKQLAPALEDHGVGWLEDPIDHRDLAGYRQLVGTVGVAITHGEYHYGTEVFSRIVAERAADVVMIDAHHAGGIAAWVRAAKVCENAFVPVATHLSPEIGVHLAAAVTNCRTVEYMDWSFALWEEPPALVDGRLSVPTAPGLGVTLDEGLLRSRRLDR